MVRKYYNKYFEDKQNRITTTVTGSLAINAFTGVSQLVIGLIFLSPWYIINSVYNLLLSAARVQSVRQYKKAIAIEDEKDRYDNEFAVHKRGGIFICLMGISYLGICIWMFFTGESKVQNEMVLVLCVATVAFTKISLAIHGMIVNRHMHDPIVSLFKKIAFLDAMVSIVVTQCSLLTMMETAEAVGSSALFGMGVSLLFLAIGIFMLVKKKKYPVPETPKEKKDKYINGMKKITVFDLFNKPVKTIAVFKAIGAFFKDLWKKIIGLFVKNESEREK